jgi:2-octaprenyl-6-methoxyphenol hydroxylase
MAERERTTYDVAVVGGGATGFAAATVAAAVGMRTVLFAPPSLFPSGRTAALLQGSVELLEELRVWPDLEPHAAPLRAIRIVDATSRLIRAPEVTFEASEIGLPAFGFNIGNGRLVTALLRRAPEFPNLTIVPDIVQRFAPGADEVTLHAGEVPYPARLVVAADGARSAARESAGIATRSWSHGQAALVTTFSISRPHSGVSTEFHGENGPFTLVPLLGDRVSLVWMDHPGALQSALRLEDEAFSLVAEKKAHSIHGAMRVDSERVVIPLRTALAERFAANRTMLVGEAAHLFPPIGAQGLNLGFRDVAALRTVLSDHHAHPGAAAGLEDYQRARAADVRSRTLAVDLLNRSILTGFLPIQAARGVGIGLASSLPPLRRALMRYGLAPRFGAN